MNLRARLIPFIALFSVVGSFGTTFAFAVPTVEVSPRQIDCSQYFWEASHVPTVLNRPLHETTEAPTREYQELKLESTSDPTENTQLLKMNGKIADQVEEVGYFKWSVDGTRLHVEDVFVAPAARKQGVIEYLFLNVLVRNPGIEKVSGAMDRVNNKIAVDSLREELMKLPDFATLNQGKHWIPDESFAHVLETDSELGAQYRFSHSCQNAYKTLEKNDPNRLTGLVESALKKTPAYRMRKRVGFSRFCIPPKINSGTSTTGLFKIGFSFIGCR